jgi:hypothetical protein
MRIALFVIVLASSLFITAFSQRDPGYYRGESTPVEELIESLQDDLNDLNRYAGGKYIHLAGLEWRVMSFSDSLVSLELDGSHDRTETLMFWFNARKDLVRRIRNAKGFVDHSKHTKGPMPGSQPLDDDWFKSADTISFFDPPKYNFFKNEIRMKHVGYYAHKYQSENEGGQRLEQSYSLKYVVVLGSNHKHVFHLPVLQKPG